MDESRSREIAERAATIRPMLDLGEYARQRRFLFGGIFLLAVLGPNAIRAMLSPHIGATRSWIVCWALMGALIVAALAFHRVRRRRSRESRTQMLCPRCRYILREDGPESWTTCGDTTRVCPECAFAVSDDVYAAAALPTLRERADRVVGFSSGVLIAIGVILTLFLGAIPVAMLGMAYFGNFGGIALGLAMYLLVVALGFALAHRTRNHADAIVASWVDSPWCPACDAPLSDEVKDASLWVCAECDQRVSPPAASAEARRAAIR